MHLVTYCFILSQSPKLIPEQIWLNVGAILDCRRTVSHFSNSCLSSFSLTPFHLVGKLNAVPELIPEDDVSTILFDGVPAAKFNFAPIISLAGEYFTHLGLTCMFIHFILEALHMNKYGQS